MVSPVTTLTLSSETKATLFRIMSWRCRARSEHGIARPKTYDRRWAARPRTLPRAPQAVQHRDACRVRRARGCAGPTLRTTPSGGDGAMGRQRTDIGAFAEAPHNRLRSERRI